MKKFWRWMAGQLHNNVNILNASEVLNATVHIKLVKMVNCVMCILPQLKRNHVKNHSCTDSRLYWWGYQPSFLMHVLIKSTYIPPTTNS